MTPAENHIPLIYGHRGACASAPENTLAAFKLALAQGADGIELDVKLSKDGQLIIMHDLSVDRTTTGTGLVAALAGDEIRHLDAGSKFAEQFKGEPVPTLAEVFEAVGNKLTINIELTNYSTPTDALPVKVADLIQEYHLEESVIISSFHPLNLIRFRLRLPRIPLGLLCLEGKEGAWSRGWVGRRIPQDALHPYFTDTTAELVQATHQRGKKINVWTVDSIEEARRLSSLGVDGIITNDPKKLRESM